MPLRGEDISVARTNGGANVLRLARFLGDDDLIRQDGHFQIKRYEAIGWNIKGTT
jgi:hypothetical protein